MTLDWLTVRCIMLYLRVKECTLLLLLLYSVCLWADQAAASNQQTIP